MALDVPIGARTRSEGLICFTCRDDGRNISYRGRRALEDHLAEHVKIQAPHRHDLTEEKN